jgi:response regulator RpfG family c-di-GMP phosphodiesterase
MSRVIPRVQGPDDADRPRKGLLQPTPIWRTKLKPSGTSTSSTAMTPCTTKTAGSLVDVHDMRILVVDDQESHREYIREILHNDGYQCVIDTGDPHEVAQLCQAAPRPDLLMIDLSMPGRSGYEVLEEIGLLNGQQDLAVIVITADGKVEAKRRSLSLGANEFLTKPVDSLEVLLRVGNLLRAQRLTHGLRDLVERRTEELVRSRLETVHCLAVATEYRDDDTGHHTHRVGHTAALIARELSEDAELIRLIQIAAPLHDVGKIGVPDAILLKPGRLTDDEMDIMRQHVPIGAGILASGGSPELLLAHEIALFHHERWDGQGYGGGLAGASIPLAARITAAADSFDAITHKRPYKEAWPIDQAIGEMVSQRGRQFDPDVIDAFMRLDHRIVVEPILDARGEIPQVAPLS